MNFYHQKERILRMGIPDDDYVNKKCGRREIFDITADERWIGCELNYCKDYFCGVTWLKMKVCH
jgi:hypothetical protein